MTADPAEVAVDLDDVAVALRVAMRRGGDWAEVYVERSDRETVRLDGGGVDEIRTDHDVGAAVRVITSGRAGYAYTNLLTLHSLAEAAEAAAAASGSGRTVAAAEIDLRAAPAPLELRPAKPPMSSSAADKVELLRRIDGAARAHSVDVRQVTAVHTDHTQDVLIATSEGRVVRDRRVRTRATCRVTVVRNGALQRGFDGPGAGMGMEMYDLHPPAQIGVTAAERAVRALDGRPAPSGEVPVVLGSAAGGMLLHEACGHGLEGDGLARESSTFAGTFGHRVASPLVTAIDEPQLRCGYGSYRVDDEGTAGERTVLLEAGVQVGALTDLVTARLLGRSSTANGRRESYARPPLTRMSNTYIDAGADEPDAIIGDVDRGVYVARLKGGEVDNATGRFAFAVSEAYLIERGRLTRPVIGLMLTGDGPAAMSSVAAVGNDLGFTEARCGKDGQWVPVSYGSPTLLITGLTVAGHRHG
ncbi:MAG: TldD/PmbA family protein [Nocardioidaceae bacterium]